MKHFIHLALCLISSLVFSQTHRFIYEFQHKVDSTSDDKETEMMTLDINPKEIKFYSYEYAKNDSINKVRNYTSYSWDERLPAIKRKINSDEHINYVMLNDYFAYKSQDKMNWHLSDETKTENGYLLQKATTQFGGRHWTAWFAKDINLIEGPYKFRGLPGLIFEVYDDKDNFSFKLLKSWKLPQTYDTSDFLEHFAGKKPIVTSLKMIQKKQLEFYENPLREMREQFNPNMNGELRVMGVKIIKKEQFDELTKKAQEYMRKEYNPIEISNAVRYPQP
ncbi:GLPGLI family protein [Riemerella columbina]|uniref:GLPGLI family protein n=1 Tax=Riemerella columbina TaxID=103810 RepID=UPI0003726558|nr:GLPGLI family protein [Riemerella columbina]